LLLDTEILQRESYGMRMQETHSTPGLCHCSCGNC